MKSPNRARTYNSAPNVVRRASMSTMTPIAPQRTWGGRCGSLNRTLVPTRMSIIRRSPVGRRLVNARSALPPHVRGWRGLILRRLQHRGESPVLQRFRADSLVIRHRLADQRKAPPCRAGRWRSFSVVLHTSNETGGARRAMVRWRSLDRAPSEVSPPDDRQRDQGDDNHQHHCDAIAHR
jgi:hypothetical protein